MSAIFSYRSALFCILCFESYSKLITNISNYRQFGNGPFRNRICNLSYLAKSLILLLELMELMEFSFPNKKMRKIYVSVQNHYDSVLGFEKCVTCKMESAHK